MLLSICIPFFNRFEKLRNIIAKITTSHSNDFEVIILDNKSSKNIYDEIDAVDKRVRIKIQNSSVPAPINALESLLNGNGKYVLLLLDKDCIDGETLDDFICELKKNDDVAGGYCLQNRYKYIKKVEVISSMKEKLLKFAYPCRHPSGYFFLKEYLKEIYNNKLIPIQNNAFIFDFFITECAIKKDMMIYDYPFLYTETLTEAKKIKSYTYGDEKKNIYFFPNERIRYFNLFVNHLEKIITSNELRKDIVVLLYKRLLYDVTIGYKSIMSNDAICIHNNLSTKRIGNKEMLSWAIEAMNAFYLMDDSIYNQFEKKEIMKKTFSGLINDIY